MTVSRTFTACPETPAWKSSSSLLGACGPVGAAQFWVVWRVRVSQEGSGVAFVFRRPRMLFILGQWISFFMKCVLF